MSFHEKSILKGYKVYGVEDRIEGFDDDSILSCV
jgi:hypothetical protein